MCNWSQGKRIKENEAEAIFEDIMSGKFLMVMEVRNPKN